MGCSWVREGTVFVDCTVSTGLGLRAGYEARHVVSRSRFALIRFPSADPAQSDRTPLPRSGLIKLGKQNDRRLCKRRSTGVRSHVRGLKTEAVRLREL